MKSRFNFGVGIFLMFILVTSTFAIAEADYTGYDNMCGEKISGDTRVTAGEPYCQDGSATILGKCNDYIYYNCGGSEVSSTGDSSLPLAYQEEGVNSYSEDEEEDPYTVQECDFETTPTTQAGQYLPQECDNGLEPTLIGKCYDYFYYDCPEEVTPVEPGEMTTPDTPQSPSSPKQSGGGQKQSPLQGLLGMLKSLFNPQMLQKLSGAMKQKPASHDKISLGDEQ